MTPVTDFLSQIHDIVLCCASVFVYVCEWLKFVRHCSQDLVLFIVYTGPLWCLAHSMCLINVLWMNEVYWEAQPSSCQHLLLLDFPQEAQGG